jgi:hypothetical protein
MGGTDRKRTNVLMLSWKRKGPFLPEHRELLARLLCTAKFETEVARAVTTAVAAIEGDIAIIREARAGAEVSYEAGSFEMVPSKMMEARRDR